MRISVLLIIVCLGIVAHGLEPYSNITIPVLTQNFDYSPDQKYLALYAPTIFSILNAQTGDQIQNLTFADPLTPTSFAFNADSSLLAIGFQNGQAHIYERTDKKFEETTYKYIDSNKTTINSVCFSSDSKTLVLGLQKNQIAAWDYVNNINDTEVFGTTIFTDVVACSPTDPTLFVAGGAENTNSKFAFYKFTEGKIQLVHDVPTETGSGVFDAAFSADGARVYRVGRNGVIYYYDTIDPWTQSIFNQDKTTSKQIFRIRLSANLGLIAIAIENKAYLFTNTQSLRAQPQEFNLGVDSIALTQKGGFLFFVNTQGKGATYAQCPKGKYSDNAGSCPDCDVACTSCFGTEKQCYGCNARYFLDETTCERCSPGCIDCDNAATCNNCDANFHKQGALCVCDDGFYQDEDTCVSCHTGCKKCDATTCIECKEQFEQNGTECKCKKGTYASGETCLSCGIGCVECQNGDVCDECNVAEHFVLKDNKCQCDAEHHFVADGENCKCADRYYLQGGVCQECPFGCAECTDANHCSSCINDDLIVDEDTHLCVCKEPATYFDPDGTCHECGQTLDYCIKCTSATTCTQCQAGIHRIPVDGKCQCQPHYWEDEALVCQECTMVGCKNCQNTDTCLECDLDRKWVLDEATHICYCQKHYSQVGDECVECPVGCATCNITDCISCDTDEHWIFDENQTVCVCIKGWYEQDKQCNKCMIGCLDCQQKDECGECDEANSFIKTIEGKCQCKVEFYLKDQECLNCGQAILSCLECSDGNTCTKCKDSLVVNDTKRCGCSKTNEYVDDKDGTCKNCPEGCSTCDHVDICTSCSQGYSKDGDSCKKDGLDVLVIVLIVVGVIVLAGAIFVIIKCIKKRRTALSQEDYEQL